MRLRLTNSFQILGEPKNEHGLKVLVIKASSNGNGGWHYTARFPMIDTALDPPLAPKGFNPFPPLCYQPTSGMLPDVRIEPYTLTSDFFGPLVC